MRLSAAVAVCSFIFASLAAAQEAAASVRKYTLIPPQRLGPALQQLARDRDVQVVYRSEIVGDRTTSGATGELTVEESLTRLLSGTGLTFRYLDQRAITIVPLSTVKGDREQQPQSSAVPVQGTSLLAESIRVAQADIASGADEDRRTGDPAQSERPVALNEVVVTGSRLRRPVGEDSSPVVVFDRRKIEELGVSTLSDVLSYSTQQTFMLAETSNLTGAQYAQMRGLPVGSTAILINGRRVPVSAANVNANGINLNMIPLAAIDRVEILADSASAMYGADAVGGVMNVILKKEIDHPVLDVRYGSAAGGAQERRASLTAGHVGTRLRASFVLDYFDKDPLLGAERARWANQDHRRFGGVDRRIANANPATVVSTTNSNLPGLSSRFAITRPGSTGAGLTSADFIAVPSQADLSIESALAYEAIVLGQESRSAAVFAELDLTNAIGLFAEGYYTDKQITDLLAPPTATFTVPRDNPFNPFGTAALGAAGVPVSVRYLFEGMGLSGAAIEQDMYSITAGAKGLAGTWDWEVAALGARSTAGRTTRSGVNNQQLTCVLTNPATRPAGACGGITEALNVFEDGSGGSAALLASLAAPPIVFAHESEAAQATAFVRGPAFSLPAGDVETVVGASYGIEKILDEQLAPTTRVTPGERTNYAAFAEMRVPLVSSSMQIPAISNLSIKLAARHDHYDDFGDTFNPQYGLIWVPVSGLTLTASYGTSFSPPSLFNLHRPRTVVTTNQVFDPRRNEVVFPGYISGGNPELEPEEGRSFTTGAIVSPGAVPNLRFSMHYWEVLLKNRVSALGADSILADEVRFADRVVRQSSATGVGALLSVDTSVVNFARLETSGIDWVVSWSRDTSWGRFSPSLSATWTGKFESTDFPLAPPQNRVSLAASDGAGTIPRWKGVSTLAWAKRGFGLSATARWISSYADTTSAGGRYVPTGRRIPSQTLVDLQASVDLTDVLSSPPALFEGLKVSGGVTNLSDKEPPFLGAIPTGYDQSQGNLVGRFAYIGLSKDF